MIKNRYGKLMMAALAGVCVGAALGLAIVTRQALAEQSGSSPESGASAEITTLYTDLVSLSFGSDSDTPDWGTYWNRIKTAAKWVPSGNATVGDVKSGQTFFNNSRTQQTGTYPAPGPCSTQQYHDSYGAPVTETTNCTDTITWTTADPAVTGDDNKAGKGNKDPRTGLTWSQLLLNNSGTVAFSPTTNSTWNWNGTLWFTVTAANATAGATYTNNGQTFTVVTTITGGTSLNATATGNPAASGTLTKTSGTGDDTITFSATGAGTNNAAVGGKTASELCSERGDGWRLPTQKELMQAYVDGSYFNLTQPSNYFWSTTEYSSTNAWYVTLTYGTTSNNSKSTNSYQVRCVR